MASAEVDFNAAGDWFSTGERVPVTLASGTFEVFCRVAGSGRWLTLLHAFPTSSWDWARVSPPLERRFRVLCFDFLGFGDSDKPRRHRYSVAEQADLTEQLWRRFRVDETGLVAHDYGASVAQELLARDLDGRLGTRLTGAVLMNAALYPGRARPLLVQRALANRVLGPLASRLVGERTFARGLASVFSRSHPITVDQLAEHWRVVQRRGGSARIAHRLGRYLVDRRERADRWEAALEQARPPITLLWGMEDPRSGAPMAAYVRRRAPETRLVELRGVGHYPQLEVPERVAAEIAAAFDAALEEVRAREQTGGEPPRPSSRNGADPSRGNAETPPG